MDHQPGAGRPPDESNEPGDPGWDAIARDLAGEADPASASAARAWRREHPDDAAAVDALDRTLDRLAFAAPPDLDVEAALRRVKARRNEEPARPADVIPLRPRRSAWPAVTRAAAALLLVAGGVAGWRALRGREPRGDVAGRTFSTAVGVRDSVLLADGSRVLLGPGSTLDVAGDFGSARREVRLRGEAYFTVRHDARAPFVVRTGAASVHDVGTAFVVRDGSDGRVTVAVTEGVVMLRATTADTTGVLVRAHARGVVVPGQSPVVATDVVTAQDLSWTRGELAFRDAPFPEVAAELRRWYGVELRPADPSRAASLAARHLTAAFHGEPADEVLRVVALALGASIERRGDTAFVRVTPAR